MKSLNDYKSLRHPIWSFGLVFSQFLLIAVILLQTFPWQTDLVSIVVQISAILLGLWALKTMHLGHFNIIPDPMPDIDLVTTGPYRFIRHPMYASILYFFIPIAITENRLEVWLSYLVLLATLLFKLHYEEYLLTQKLTDYPKYQTRSKKILPFIF